ncbi:MAG: hypothetical protein LBV69_06835, partial [Bacteroidales bacterium]|nr:hypothetical protein [Bacteroidales bacterium]
GTEYFTQTEIIYKLENYSESIKDKEVLSMKNNPNKNVVFRNKRVVIKEFDDKNVVFRTKRVGLKKFDHHKDELLGAIIDIKSTKKFKFALGYGKEKTIMRSNILDRQKVELLGYIPEELRKK